jgi:hypothetical protein
MGRGKLCPDANFHAGFGENYLLLFVGNFKMNWMRALLSP